MTLVTQSMELPSGELRLLQPEESAELPDDGRGRVGAARAVLVGAVAQRSGARARARWRSCSTACAWSSWVAGSPFRASPPRVRARRCSPRTRITEALELVAQNAQCERCPGRDGGGRLGARRTSWSAAGRSTWCSPPTSSTSGRAWPCCYRSCRGSRPRSGWPTPAGRRPTRSSRRREAAGQSRRAFATSSRSTFCGSTERPGRRASERRGDAQVPLLAHRGSRARRWQECRSHGRAALSVGAGAGPAITRTQQWPMPRTFAATGFQRRVRIGEGTSSVVTPDPRRRIVCR